MIFEEGTVDHERYIHEVLQVALKFENHTLGSTGGFNKMEEGHIFTKKLKIDVTLISHLSLTEVIGLQIVLISIRWTIAFGMNFARAINWDLVASKVTLINQLKLSLKQICTEVVFESCISWTNRLDRFKQVNGNNLHK